MNSPVESDYCGSEEYIEDEYPNEEEETEEDWVVEKIVKKRTRKVEGCVVTEYLVKWEGKSDEFNEWIAQHELEFEDPILVRNFEQERQKKKKLEQQQKTLDISTHRHYKRYDRPKNYGKTPKRKVSTSPSPPTWSQGDSTEDEEASIHE